MNNPKECRKFRAILRNGEYSMLEKAKEHIASCPECRKTIEKCQTDNSLTQYKGDSIQQVLNNSKPVQPTRRWR
jgi:hypothetical protein